MAVRSNSGYIPSNNGSEGSLTDTGVNDDQQWHVCSSGMKQSTANNFGYYQTNPLDAFKAMYKPALNRGLTVGGVASFAVTSLALVTIGLPGLAASSLFAFLGVWATPFGRQSPDTAAFGFYGMSLTGLVGKGFAGVMSLVLFAGNLGGKGYTLQHSYRQAEALVNYPANMVRQYRINILEKFQSGEWDPGSYDRGGAHEWLTTIPQSRRLFNDMGATKVQDPSKKIFPDRA